MAGDGTNQSSIVGGIGMHHQSVGNWINSGEVSTTGWSW